MSLDVTPEPEDIVQAEEDSYDTRPVPVAVCGPVESRELPAVRAGYRTEPDITTTVGVKLLSFEPRRKEAVIIALDQDIWISGSQSGAQLGASGAFRVPAVVPYRIGNLGEVWACAVTGTTDVSVQVDYWSE